MSIEERLERLEKLLKEVAIKIAWIESVIKSHGRIDETIIATKLAMAMLYPASMAIDAARRVIETVRAFGPLDPISQSIVEALSPCEELSISEITRRVKSLRGTASRRIVAGRLKILESRGIIVNTGTGERPRYILYNCM